MRVSRRPARIGTLAGLVFLTFWTPGCTPDRPTGPLPVHPVEGRVTYLGKPVAGAQVSLLPDDPARFGESVPRPTGRTDEEGRFKLMTYAEGDGAPDGSYLVGIIGQSRPQNEAGNRLDAAQAATNAPDVLQGRFTDPKTSGLKATIKPGETTLPPFDLDEKSAGAAGASPSRGDR